MSESSLIKKLAAVMKAVERIPKNGHNSFYNYDYATEADIVAAVRNELASRNVICLPTIGNRHREPVGEKGMVLTHLDMTFTFVDGDTGEREVCPWLGAGADKEDKGVYKAMTGGEKYFLLKTFLIPTGDDPEQDGNEIPAGAAPVDGEPQHPANMSARRSTPTPPPTPPEQRARDNGHGSDLLISEAQSKRLYAIAKNNGWEDRVLKDWLVNEWGYHSSKDIRRRDYDAICKAVEGRG